MKRSIITFPLFFAVTFFFCRNLEAQVTRVQSTAATNTTTSSKNFTGAKGLVTLNNFSTYLQNFFATDSFKSPHTASFEFDLNPSNDSKKILSNLLSAIQNNQSLEIVFREVNSQNQVVSQKDYKSTTVNEILFSDLNGGSKDILRIQVKVQAQDASETDGANETAPQLPASGKAALCANFKLTVGKLPTQRVSRISSIRINNPGSYGYLNFSVEIQRVDSKPWKDWYTSGAGGGRREDATLSLMDANFSTEVASIYLSQVEIVSVSEAMSSQDNIAKTVFGLRARRVKVN